MSSETYLKMEESKLEQLLANIISAALQPFLQTFYNILIEIRDRLPVVLGAALPPSPPTIQEPAVQMPSFVYEVPKGAVQVPEQKEVSRQELGELGVKVYTTAGADIAKGILMPFQKGPVPDGEPYPSIGNIDPVNYSKVAVLFSEVLAKAVTK